MPELLGPTDVHVWHRLTDQIGPADQAAAAARLSEDERARAARFMFERDRVSFIAAHDLLRTVLSQYEDVPPPAWRFVTAPHGKPALEPAQAACQLRFNLSHTTGLVACAVTRGLEVGVDVERVPDPGARADLGDLAARFFSPQEAASLAACAEDERDVRFIEFWTLKESFVKAVGQGLSHPLDTFSFSLAAHGGIGFDPPPHEDGARWQFALGAPTSRHRLAVAVRRDTATGLTIGSRGRLPWSNAACILSRFRP